MLDRHQLWEHEPARYGVVFRQTCTAYLSICMQASTYNRRPTPSQTHSSPTSSRVSASYSARTVSARPGVCTYGMRVGTVCL